MPTSTTIDTQWCLDMCRRHTNNSHFCLFLSAWSSNVLELCFYRTVLHQRQFFFRCLHLHFLQCITHIQTLHDTILTKYVTVHFTIQLINNEKSIFNVRIRVNYVESSTNIVHTYVFSLLLYSWCPLSCPCAFFLNIFFSFCCNMLCMSVIELALT